MNKLAYRASIAALAALFGFAGLASAPASAQQTNQPAKAAPAKPAAKKSMAAKKKAPSESVKALQAALNKNGATLKVDGMMGPTTRAALKKYQAANGLKATGRDDKATRDKLGIGA
jgi:peptidoglycan hydrolase-like protein with peptidoglycan-binding domain